VRDQKTRDYLDKLRQDIVFEATLKGQPYCFHTTWGLFSPRDIDEGTRLLIDHLEIRPDDHALDLGCGYGPIGLVIGHEAPQGSCIMVDKDFVAVEYARLNAKFNAIHNVEARLSDGFRHLGNERFSLVVSNLPAKTTKEHYHLFFHDAFDRLETGGRLYVVVISGLREFIKRTFSEIFGNHTKVKQGRSYTVAMAVKEG